jgi:hypothetical protein
MRALHLLLLRWRMQHRRASLHPGTFPEKFARIAQMERDMNHAIDPKLTVEQKANLGTPYPEASDRTLIAELKDEHWDKHYSIFTSDWKLPAGAFRKCGGPL